MEKHTQKIKGFSGVVYVLLQIIFWLMIAASAFITLAYILELVDSQISSMLPGVDITLPKGQQIGNTNIILPEFDFSGYGLHFKVDFGNLFAYAVILVVLSYAKRIFNLLRRDGNPFRTDIVNNFKKLAIAMLLVGVSGGIVGFIGAAIVFVLCLVFNYGAALQNESDTTL